MITHRSWLGISNRECLIESDTRQLRPSCSAQQVVGDGRADGSGAVGTEAS